MCLSAGLRAAFSACALQAASSTATSLMSLAGLDEGPTCDLGAMAHLLSLMDTPSLTALAQCSFSMLRTILQQLPPGRRLRLRLHVQPGSPAALPQLSARLWAVAGQVPGLSVALSRTPGECRQPA